MYSLGVVAQVFLYFGLWSRSNISPLFFPLFSTKKCRLFLNVNDVFSYVFFCTEDLTLIGHTHAVDFSFSGGHPK